MRVYKWLCLAWALLVLLAVPGIYHRTQWEMEQRNVAVLFDSLSLETLSRETETNWEDWAARLKAHGMTGLAVREENLERLKRRGVLTWRTSLQARAEPGWLENYPPSVRDWLQRHDRGVVVTLWDRETRSWLEQSLNKRAVEYNLFSDGETSYLLLRGGEELSRLPLGIWPQTVQGAQKLGLSLCPVVELPGEGNDLALADALYAQWEQLDCPILLAWGEELPGAQEDEQAAVERMEVFLRRGAALALTERSGHGGNLELEGKDALIRDAGERLLRSYYQWDYISDDYGTLGYPDSRAVSYALSRSAGERNCHVLWLNAMADGETGEPIEELEAYEKLLDQLTGDLERMGMTPGLPAQGKAVGQEIPIRVRLLLSWLTGTGTGCICVLLLLRAQGKIWPIFAGELLAAVGGLAAAGWLCTTPVFVGEAAFRGVKAAQLVPLALFVLLWARQRWREHTEQLIHFWESPVTGRTLALSWCLAGGAAVVLGLGWYYVVRTGNSGLAADWELRLRDWLEELCTVRPRFKEFLLGLPCLILWCRGKLGRIAAPLVGAGAVIGLTSVTNTFFHCTPLYLSLIRTAAGWVLGAAVGIALLFVWREGRRRLWPMS